MLTRIGIVVKGISYCIHPMLDLQVRPIPRVGYAFSKISMIFKDYYVLIITFLIGSDKKILASRSHLGGGDFHVLVSLGSSMEIIPPLRCDDSSLMTSTIDRISLLAIVFDEKSILDVAEIN